MKNLSARLRRSAVLLLAPVLYVAPSPARAQQATFAASGDVPVVVSPVDLGEPAANVIVSKVLAETNGAMSFSRSTRWFARTKSALTKAS